MPYPSINDLPEAVREHLPEHAQHIYQKAFNHAWEEYQDSKKRLVSTSLEETAHRVAWAAVKHKYTKNTVSRQWEPKDPSE